MKSLYLFGVLLVLVVVLVTQGVYAKDAAITVGSAVTFTSQTDSFSRNGVPEAVSITLNAKSADCTVQYFDENGWHTMAVDDTVTAGKIRLLTTSQVQQDAQYDYVDIAGPVIVSRQMVIGAI